MFPLPRSSLNPFHKKGHLHLDHFKALYSFSQSVAVRMGKGVSVVPLLPGSGFVAGLIAGYDTELPDTPGACGLFLRKPQGRRRGGHQGTKALFLQVTLARLSRVTLLQERVDLVFQTILFYEITLDVFRV